MDNQPVSDYEFASIRAAAGLLTRYEAEQILNCSVTNNVPSLKVLLAELGTKHGTTTGVLLLRARDKEGRNAVHYAAIGHCVKILEYLLDHGHFPNQPALRVALFHTTTTGNGENTAHYAIRQHCPPSFFDAIISAGTSAILEIPTADGFSPLHCAAIEDAAELITHMVATYDLDPCHAFTARTDDTNNGNNIDKAHLCVPVEGDTPLHLAARYNSAAAFEALDKLGVNVFTVLNSEGEAAIDVAAKANATAVIAYLDQPPPMAKDVDVDDDAPLSEIESVVETEEDILRMYACERKEDVPNGIWKAWREDQKKWRRKHCQKVWDWDD
ncbi:ankyrin repeat-containing domain protein [Chaetomidium leptoderma]|uniref:Ankyrin repeat-containing domain protein n=1 Tax=Chaetomidium leptoderma TaxID=669021 RepID=A0AAN6VN94_9PEZI|nr:ankyrin repeat-containing domain protein [Chaetomidium leptoderma]